MWLSHIPHGYQCFTNTGKVKMNYEELEKRDQELLGLIEITKKQIEQLVANLNMMMGAHAENKRVMGFMKNPLSICEAL